MSRPSTSKSENPNLAYGLTDLSLESIGQVQSQRQSEADDTQLAPSKAEEEVEDTSAHLSGRHLFGTTLALAICAFFAQLDVTIVATALVKITDDLQGFEISSWIVTAYLLTYNGFLIIWAKLSDILGRKSCTTAALLIFVIFSGACGAAQTMTQLAIFRSLQGIGASGLTTLSFVIVPEMVATAKYALYSTIMASAFAFSYLCGPLVGGAICNSTTWRWVFLINIPIGVVALVILYISLPNNFPNHARGPPAKLSLRDLLTRIDYVGTFLLFGFSVFLVAALEEAGTHYAWSSATIIVLLVFAGVFFICFVTYAYVLDKGTRTQEPVFTWRLLTNRVFVGSLSVSFFAGAIFTVAVIQIPQRFQIVNGASPLLAGVRLLPYTLCVSVGVVLSTVLATKARLPVVVVVCIGSALQVVAVALMSYLPVEVGPKNYGYETLLSLGLGISLGIMTLLMPQLIRGKDQSVAMGASNQFRSLGGVIGLAVATNVLSSYVKSKLRSRLTPEQLDSLLQAFANTNSLPVELQKAIQVAYSDGYNLQMKILIGFGCAQILVLALMWERPMRRVV